ncbi:amidase domain-containing protein [Paenibacillus sp. TC-CSREp1]|uniref:amidase domain-containing protein n=1 Tax=Paenibacillus sp. TC-CSREp1 TaxID=3410089 RepID=UPI003CFE1B74
MKKVWSNVLLSSIVFSMCIPTAQAQFNSASTIEQDGILSDRASNSVYVDSNGSLDLAAQDKIVDSFVVSNSFSLAKDILQNYYKNINTGTKRLDSESNVFAENLNPDLSSYLERKISTKQFVVGAAKAQKENYVLKYNLLSSEVTDEGILLTISTEASFNYVGVKEQSGFGEVSKMLFKNTGSGLILSDWYMPYDYYDEYVRGEQNQLNTLTDIDAKPNNSLIAAKQEELNDKIMEYFFVDRELPTEIKPIDGERESAQPITTFATLSSLNKSSIANYAKNNKSKDQPSSGGAGVSYYDFSQIANNWDCTNFVSHALLAGGAIQYDTNNTGISSTGWYYRNLSNRASSWSGVPNLYNFLVSNTTKGPSGNGITYSTFKYNANTGYPYQVGDVLQFYLSGSYNNWRHSTIITGYYETNTNLVLGALVTGRSAKNIYNDNQKAEEVYPGESKRVIKLTGYYK